jgi:hypothetical protein
MRSLFLGCSLLIFSASLSAQSLPTSSIGWQHSSWQLRPPALSHSLPSSARSFLVARAAKAGQNVGAGETPLMAEPSLDASGIFVETPLYSSGGFGDEAMAVADVNGDGIADIIVINSTVNVQLGNADGTFQPAVSYSSGGEGPFALAVADLNNDGKLDIVVANLFSSTVGVLLGNGDGTFQSAVIYSSGGDEAVSVAVKDVNGDNKPDIIVANLCAAGSNCASSSDGSVTILLGNGDGTFQTGATYGSGGYFTESVAVEDLNGDGKPDIVVADFCSSGASCSAGGAVGVLLNNGDGTFKPAVTYGSGGDQPLFVTIADINGDKKPDIIVGNTCSNCLMTAEGSVGVLLGNGNGTFQTAQPYDSGGFTAISVAIMDVNHDGYPDLLVANQSTETSSNSALGVLLGKADGTFQAPVTYNLAGVDAESLAIADVNGDGNPDVLVSNFYEYLCNLCAPGAISVALGNGDGTFQAALDYASGGTSVPGGINPESSAAADFNNDGNLDLVVANQCPASGPCTNGTVAVFLGNGRGNFQPPLAYSSGGAQADSVAVADLNLDGNKDIVVANYCASADCSSTGSVGVLLGNGDGTFQTAVTYNSTGFQTVSIAVADVNGDDIPDIVLANSCVNNNDCSTGSVDVFLGNGDGTFQVPISYNSGGSFTGAVTVADVNGDNRPDIIVANGCGQGFDCVDGPNVGGVAVLLNKGNGTFHAAVIYPSGGENAESLAVADMNGDGKPDLIVANNCAVVTFGACPGGGIAILLGDGNGKFQPAQTFSTPLSIGAGQIAIADFNDDGKLDVASGAAQFLLLGNGDGTLQTPTYLGTSGPATTAADFNNDGTPDLAVGGLTLLLNRKAAARVGLTSSINPSLFGQAVTLTAIVSGTTGTTPTGTVTFASGATELGTVSLNDGSATLTYSALSAGLNDITATYSGDSHFNPTTSAFSQKVRPTTTTIELISSPNPAALNQPITYTATVLSKNGGAVSGNVIFKDNDKITTVLVTGGVAKLTETYPSSDAHLVTATYSGDDNNSASISGVLKQFVEVLPVASKTLLKSSGSPSPVGSPVTFTASVASIFGKIPDGEIVTFFDGSTPIGTGSTGGGIATFTTSSLTVEAHAITATYSGDSTFASSSGHVSQVVTLYGSTTKLTSTPNPSTQGQPVTLTASVSSTLPGSVTGDVTFRDGPTVLGTVALSNDVASLTTSGLPPGSLLLTANYKGSTLSLPSSGTATQTVH